MKGHILGNLGLITFRGCRILPQGFFASIQSNLTEEEHHGEDHPDVDHLDVGGGGQRLRDSNKSEKICYNFDKYITYSVARTRRQVKLTWTTISI